MVNPPKIREILRKLDPLRGGGQTGAGIPRHGTHMKCDLRRMDLAQKNCEQKNVTFLCPLASFWAYRSFRRILRKFDDFREAGATSGESVPEFRFFPVVGMGKYLLQRITVVAPRRPWPLQYHPPETK